MPNHAGQIIAVTRERIREVPESLKKSLDKLENKLFNDLELSGVDIDKDLMHSGGETVITEQPKDQGL